MTEKSDIFKHAILKLLDKANSSSREILEESQDVINELNYLYRLAKDNINQLHWMIGVLGGVIVLFTSNFDKFLVSNNSDLFLKGFFLGLIILSVVVIVFFSLVLMKLRYFGSELSKHITTRQKIINAILYYDEKFSDSDIEEHQEISKGLERENMKIRGYSNDYERTMNEEQETLNKYNYLPKIAEYVIPSLFILNIGSVVTYFVIFILYNY